MRYATAAVGLLLVGCVQTNAAVLNPTQTRRPICEQAVTVYTVPERVGRPYEEVAILNSTGNTNVTSEAGMIHSQQQKAAEVGANGVILGGIDEPSAGAKVAASIFRTSTERKGRALAIWIPDDSLKTWAICDSVAAARH